MATPAGSQLRSRPGQADDVAQNAEFKARGTTVESLTPRQHGKGKRVVVAGAGPAGILAAILLAQRGYLVDMFEKRPAPSEDERKHGGRSIVFALCNRGLDSLRSAGIRLPERVGDSLWLNGLAVSKGVFFNRHRNGKVTRGFRRLPPSVLLAERAALVEHMLLEMERLVPGKVKLHYGCSLAGIDFGAKIARFTSDGGEEQAVRFDLLVGCDGRNSGVRAALAAADPSFTFESHTSPRSYKCFNRLPALKEAPVVDEEGASVCFNSSGAKLNHFLAYFPTKYGTVSGSLALLREDFETQPNTPEAYRRLIEEHFPAVPQAWRESICQQLVEARPSPLGGGVKCSKLHGPSTVIFGDAAHGVTPATGQGANAALESAAIFIKILDECGGDTEAAPPAFTDARLADAHALFYIDATSRSRNGSEGVTFLMLATRFHMLVGFALKKLAPGFFHGPAYYPFLSTSLRYTQVVSALARDQTIFAGLLAAAGAGVLALLRSATPRLTAWLA